MTAVEYRKVILRVVLTTECLIQTAKTRYRETCDCTEDHRLCISCVTFIILPLNDEHILWNPSSPSCSRRPWVVPEPDQELLQDKTQTQHSTWQQSRDSRMLSGHHWAWGWRTCFPARYWLYCSIYTNRVRTLTFRNTSAQVKNKIQEPRKWAAISDKDNLHYLKK